MTISACASERRMASRTTSCGGRDLERPRARRVAQKEHLRSQPSCTLSQPRDAPRRLRSSRPPIGSVSIRSSGAASSICTSPEPRSAWATDTGSWPGITSTTPGMARYASAFRAAEHPATTTRAFGRSRCTRRMNRRASASAWLVTVHVFTTTTSASSRPRDVTAPRASSSWRIRSVSYWLALQPKVW